MKLSVSRLLVLVLLLPIYSTSYSASGASSTKKITTCTNIQSGLHRILLKGSCTPGTEKKELWNQTLTKSVSVALMTCENTKTKIIRVLVKGNCIAKSEKISWWINSAGGATSKALTYKIGEIGPGGGRIFFVDSKYVYPGFDYLEAAPSDVKSATIWCSDVSRSITKDNGNLEKAIGAGNANTTSMLETCNSGAASAAKAYSNNGKNDWYLPSREELLLMYQNIRQYFEVSSLEYWSSTENSAVFAETVAFSTGNWASIDKSFLRMVRPVRSFSEDGSVHPTSAPSIAAVSGYKVGDPGPGGGWIFFVDSKNEYPNFDYLEAAPSDINGTFLWCSNTTNSIPSLFGGSAANIGVGASNTKIMLASCTSGAANAAANYIKNGKSDWFLPSIGELKLLYDTLRKVGSLSKFGFEVGEHWSSTEAYESGAMVQNFDDRYLSSTGGSLKDQRHFVRTIRAF